jgi:hypothetical protein
MVGTWLCPQQQRAVSCLKIGHAGAILRGLDGSIGSKANPLQTKPGWSVPSHGSLLESHVWSCGTFAHTCSKGVAQVGSFYYIHEVYALLSV